MSFVLLALNVRFLESIISESHVRFSSHVVVVDWFGGVMLWLFYFPSWGLIMQIY